MIKKFAAMIAGAKAQGNDIAVHRSQLAELARHGISAADLLALGVTIGDDLPGDTVLVCVAAVPLMFRDNVITSCTACGRAIQHRPDAPVAARKLCLKCAYQETTASTSPPGAGF